VDKILFIQNLCKLFLAPFSQIQFLSQFPGAGVRFSIYKSNSYGRPFSIILAPQMKAAISISLECWHVMSTAKRLAHLKKKGEPDNGLDFSSITSCFWVWCFRACL